MKSFHYKLDFIFLRIQKLHYLELVQKNPVLLPSFLIPRGSRFSSPPCFFSISQSSGSQFHLSSICLYCLGVCISLRPSFTSGISLCAMAPGPHISGFLYSLGSSPPIVCLFTATLPSPKHLAFSLLSLLAQVPGTHFLSCLVAPWLPLHILVLICFGEAGLATVRYGTEFKGYPSE